ncbi:MAG: transketolase [Bdellovibrionales bacterium CG10_big_fil_rev_8_21_14_0_10_45_34]|nr:MAG: transketolase [Bdellovibrionales bacterium CG10_big_fil_rev_8_21_14_0_10_45_34]
MSDLSKEKQSELEKVAHEARKWIIKMIFEAKSGHPGSSLSCIDIITELFFNDMNVDPKNPLKEDRDRFVISKGHGVPALYAALGLRGYFNIEETATFRQLGSPFQGHPDRVRMPVLEASTGSLGQGLSVAQGMAMSLRMDNNPARVFCLIGDGETQEGQIWECAMSTGNFQLDNLIVFLDSNGYQIDGTVKDVMDLGDIKAKFEAFKWHVEEIDGHNMQQIHQAVLKCSQLKGKPHLIVAKTVKGKGVSFMENDNKWHGSAPNENEFNQAMKELER